MVHEIQPAPIARTAAAEPRRGLAQRVLERVVDAGLVGVGMLAPWFMGGRHPLGELVLVIVTVLVALAWLVEQALKRREVNSARTPAEWILLGAVALLLVQLAPLPQPLLDLFSPHTKQLLPLWRGNPAAESTLGNWNQVTMTPAWTRAGLILLLSYGLLFFVTVQRLKRIADVEWLLRWIAIAVVVQAVFGILQYLTSNGKFVWVYQHPFRDTYNAVMGAYINKNHFAHLMALGVGPLVWLVACALRGPATHQPDAFGAAAPAAGRQFQAAAALLALAVTLFAGLMSLSRGGAAAMFLAALLSVGALYRVKTLGKRFVAGMAGVFLLIGASLVIHGYRKVAERLDDYNSGSVDELDRGGARRAIWSADFKAVQDYSLLGAGVGSHREIYPMYLTQPWEVEFTHAENGYLQVALETGLPGLTLLLGGIAVCCAWCWRSLRSTNDRRVYLASAAVSAGLLASIVHSLADFVWYIPSLMAITVLLIACAYRLAQWSRPAVSAVAGSSAACRSVWSPRQFALAALAVMLLGPWMIYDRLCAAMAEPHWDRFLMFALDTNPEKKADKAIVDDLESVLYWTPDNAKAHLRLASLLVGRFEQLQRQSPNVMPLQQVCEAAFDSRDYFHSRAELDAWLNRAIGDHRRLLDRALWHLHRGLTQCALLGEGYIHLSDLCFLEGADRPTKTAYLDQALKVRPNDGLVLLAAGSAAALRQDADAVMNYWRPVLRCREEERRAMVRLLVSTQLPLDFVLEQFRPDLDATRLMYQQYAAATPAAALRPLLSYYKQSLQQAIQTTDADSAAPLWLELQTIFQASNQPAEGLECLRRAAATRASDFDIRLRLGRELCRQREFAEAEEHLRWCAQRRPEDQQLKTDLAAAVKGRIGGQSESAAIGREMR